MKQIKTIYEGSPEKFDEQVNAAIAEGWTLDKRGLNQYGFIAELEREIVTEEEQTCENCKHYNKPAGAEPCISCTPEEGAWKWEAEE